MKRLGLLLLAVVLLGPAPAYASVTHTTIGGVPVGLHPHTRQVVTVNHTHGYHARVSLWLLRQGRWVRVADAADGRIGYGGLVAPKQRHQGSGTTPLGTTTLIAAFGRHPRDASWGLPYRRIRAGDYWVEDNASAYYNRYRNKAQGGFRWWLPASDVNSSERLSDYPRQYEFSIVTSFNAVQVRHRGAGIFLHVNGIGATAGCVSAPRHFLVTALRRLSPSKVPVMAVGR